MRACGKPTSRSRAPTRGCSPRGASSARPTATSCCVGLTPSLRSWRPAVRSPPATRTSTWRSSGARPRSSGRGAGARAGVNCDTDREMLARELGFEDVMANSIDAVSSRDFALDYLAAAASCATHLSRLGAELVLWSSSEFGFCELPDAWSSGSSIMPQKKNPDAAELLRAKAPRIVAHLAALHGVLHGLPLAYNKDLQEDKEHLFDAVDTLELSLQAARELMRGIEFRRERMAEAAADEFLGATDVADLLVRRGVPFREAHGIVGGLVRRSLELGVPLSGPREEELAQRAPYLDASYYDALRQ